jgi:hypothetical protein
MLTDEELTQLLEEAAGSFAVPEPELQAPAQQARTPLWERRWPKVAAAAAVFVAGALLLSTTNLGGSTANDTAAKAPPFAQRDAAGVGGTTGGTTGSAAVVPGALRPLAPTGSLVDVPAADSPQQDKARIIRTGTIDLEVGDDKVSATVRAVLQKVSALHGYVADSTSDEAGEHPSASLTVRVPVASFPALLDQIRGLPVKVRSASQSGKDVTASYADVRAQIESLSAARSRYLDILSRAKTIAETLSVQQRVDDVQQQIDRLEGQRRVLADQSDFGTLTVTVSEKGASQTLATQDRTGWSKAWYDAHHGFTRGVQAILAGSGPALLVLLCAVALLLLGRGGWRVARRRLL